VPKIISECCVLVKLCHINRSGPVFFETQCMLTLYSAEVIIGLHRKI